VRTKRSHAMAQCEAPKSPANLRQILKTPVEFVLHWVRYNYGTRRGGCVFVCAVSGAFERYGRLPLRSVHAP